MLCLSEKKYRFPYNTTTVIGSKCAAGVAVAQALLRFYYTKQKNNKCLSFNTIKSKYAK